MSRLVPLFGQSMSGEELYKLCGADEGDNRYIAVVGSDLAVIAEDEGNDNYRIILVTDRADVLED